MQFPVGSVLFVDEVQNNGYTLVVTAVRPQDIELVSKALRKVVLPGQRRVHFNSESKANKSRFLRAIAELPIFCAVYHSRTKPGRVARSECIDQLLGDVQISRVARIIFEDDESLRGRERQQIAFEYHHAKPHEHPALWISDAIGWCHNRGGVWLTSVKSHIRTTIEIGH